MLTYPIIRRKRKPLVDSEPQDRWVKERVNLTDRSNALTAENEKLKIENERLTIEITRLTSENENQKIEIARLTASRSRRKEALTKTGTKNETPNVVSYNHEENNNTPGA